MAMREADSSDIGLLGAKATVNGVAKRSLPSTYRNILPNMRLVDNDASVMDRLAPAASIRCAFYLLYPDTWLAPKRRNRKRRS